MNVSVFALFAITCLIWVKAEDMDAVVVVTYLDSWDSKDEMKPMTFNLSAKFSASGIREEVKGSMIKIRPMTLCTNQHHHYKRLDGFVVVVQLYSPSNETPGCQDVVKKAEDAIKQGAVAVMFDVEDNHPARKQLLKTSPATVLPRPIIILRGLDAYRLRHNIMTRKILQARIFRSAYLRSTDVGLAQRFYDIAIFLLFFLLMILILLGLLIKLKWQHRKQNSIMTVTKTIVRRLATRHWKPRSQASVNSLSACAICLEEYKTGSELRLLPCSHEFHRKCVDPWLVVNRTCPLCLFNIVDGCWEKHSTPRESYGGDTPRSLSGHSTTAAQVHQVPLLVRSESCHETPTTCRSYRNPLLNCNGTFSDSRLDATSNLQRPRRTWRTRPELLGYSSVPYSLHDPAGMSLRVVLPSENNYNFPRCQSQRTTQSGIVERPCTLDIPKISPIVKVQKNPKLKSTENCSYYYTRPGRKLKEKSDSGPLPQSSDSSNPSLLPAISKTSVSRKYCSMLVPEVGARFYDKITPIEKSEWFISSNESDGYSTDVSDTSRTEEAPMIKERNKQAHLPPHLRSCDSVRQRSSSSSSSSISDEEDDDTNGSGDIEVGACASDYDPTGTFLSSLLWDNSSTSVTPNPTTLCSNLTLEGRERSSHFLDPSTTYPAFLFCYDNCAPVSNSQVAGDSTSHPNIYSNEWPVDGIRSFSASAPASIFGDRYQEKMVCPVLVSGSPDNRIETPERNPMKICNNDDSSFENEMGTLAYPDQKGNVESDAPDESSVL